MKKEKDLSESRPDFQKKGETKIRNIVKKRNKIIEKEYENFKISLKYLLNLRDRVDSNFMTFTMSFLYSRVVGVFVGDEVSSLNVTTVGILATLEDFLVQFNIVVVNGIIESNGNHHRNILGRQVTGNSGTIFGTETIRQNTDRGITRRSTVRIVINI